MKTEINIPNETPKELKFPLLARHKKTNFIYLFAARTRASCVASDLGSCVNGAECEYTPINDPDHWEILPPGTALTLIQE